MLEAPAQKVVFYALPFLGLGAIAIFFYLDEIGTLKGAAGWLLFFALYTIIIAAVAGVSWKLTQFRFKYRR